MEKALGPDYPDLAPTLNNLADLSRQAGDLAAADSLNRRALAIQEKVLGPNHPLVATTLDKMSATAWAAGDATAAADLALRAETTDAGTSGPCAVPRATNAIVRQFRALGYP